MCSLYLWQPHFLKMMRSHLWQQNPERRPNSNPRRRMHQKMHKTCSRCIGSSVAILFLQKTLPEPPRVPSLRMQHSRYMLRLLARKMIGMPFRAMVTLMSLYAMECWSRWTQLICRIRI